MLAHSLSSAFDRFDNFLEVQGPRLTPDAVDLLQAAAGVTESERRVIAERVVSLQPSDKPPHMGAVLLGVLVGLAVSTISRRVPHGVRVGTVDRFQGQEAPVVFYAMTCSSGEDVPRGIDFLFNKNRLNVAISRAQCIAVVVHSPRLLDADCRTLEAMELVNRVCRFVELAEAHPAE